MLGWRHQLVRQSINRQFSLIIIIIFHRNLLEGFGVALKIFIGLVIYYQVIMKETCFRTRKPKSAIIIQYSSTVY